MTTANHTASTADAQPGRPTDEYLRHLAGVLAGADATPETVLAAAAASHVERGRRTIEFAPGAAGFASGSVKVGRASAESDVPASVTLMAVESGPAVRVADVAAAFGAWQRDVAGVSAYDAWRIRFTDKYRRPNTFPGRGTAAVYVSAVLSGDPAAADTRVVQLLLRRDADD